MVYLPGGTFQMGDARGSEDEKPVHPVRVDAFALGRTPVTWGEYLRFCEATGSHWPHWLEEGSTYHLETGTDDFYSKRGVGREALDLPVMGIAWDDARAYCAWLGEQTGEVYELPTEAQWEYACRAGSATRWSCGDDEQQLGEYAWYSTNAGDTLHPVGQKQPNDWGLYDLHGNVWEWCLDWYASDYYQQLVRNGEQGASGVLEKASRFAKRVFRTPVAASDTEAAVSENPSGPATGSDRVVRGGSWYYVADYCRSAFRFRNEPSYRSINLGFRLSRKV